MSGKSQTLGCASKALNSLLFLSLLYIYSFVFYICIYINFTNDKELKPVGENHNDKVYITPSQRITITDLVDNTPFNDSAMTNKGTLGGGFQEVACKKKKKGQTKVFNINNIEL